MKRRRNAAIRFLLAAVMLIMIFPQTQNAMAEGASGTIAGFDAPVTELTVAAGTDKADLPLPTALMAMMADGARQEIPVTWNDGGLYDKDVAGDYTFTADFGASYTYASAHPVAVVTVTSAAPPQLRSLLATPTITLTNPVVLIDESNLSQTGYASVAAAMQAIGTRSGDFTVVLVGTANLYTPTAADAAALLGNGANASTTFTGKYVNGAGATITRSLGLSGTLQLGGPTTFKDINVQVTGTGTLYCNWNKTVIGSGVNATGSASAIYGGGMTAKTGDTDLTVLSGSWTTICAGNAGTNVLTGTANLSVGGTAIVTTSITSGTSAGANITVDTPAAVVPLIDTRAATNSTVTLTGAGTVTNIEAGGAGNSTVAINGNYTVATLNVNPVQTGQVAINGNCTVTGALTAKTELRLRDNATLKLQGTCSNPAASLVFGAGSKLERTATATAANNSIKEIRVEGTGAQLNVFKGAPLNVSGQQTGTAPLKLDFYNNAAPAQGDIFLAFSSAANAKSTNYSFARTDGYTGIATTGVNVIYTDLAIPGYEVGPLNRTPLYVGGHSTAAGVTDVRYSLVPRSDWKVGSGQLQYKTSEFPTLGQNYLDNYGYNTYGPNFNFTIAVGTQKFCLFGEIDGANGTRMSANYRGYKYSGDGNTLSLVYNLGANVGICYVHFTVLPGSKIMGLKWDFVNRSGAEQQVTVTHFGYLRPANINGSRSLFSGGGKTAYAYEPTTGLSLAMYVDQKTTDIPAVVGITDDICNYGWNGTLYKLALGQTQLSGAGVRHEMGIQWHYTAPAGGTVSATGGTQFGQVNQLIFVPGQTTLNNPNVDDVSKPVTHTVKNQMPTSRTFNAADWRFNAPAGITATPPATIAFTSPVGSEYSFSFNYSAALSVSPGTYPVECSITNENVAYTFTDQITVTRDTVAIDVAVLNEDGSENTGAIPDIRTGSTAPVVGTTIYKYYDGAVSWSDEGHPHYRITDIKVNGVSLPAAELEAAISGGSLTFPRMTTDKNVVITVAPEKTDVVVTKTVAGTYGDQTKPFTFTFYFFDASGAPFASGTQVSYTGGVLPGSGAAAPASGTMTLDADGKAAFTLSHGQTVTVCVDPDTKVRIVESGNIGYTTSFKDSASAMQTNSEDTGVCTITMDDRTFDFTNTRDAVPVVGIRAGGSEIWALLLVALLLIVVAVAFTYIRRRHREVRQK